MYYNTETGETNQKPKVRIENDWNSKANDFLVLVRRSFFSAEDDSEQLRHANENKTKINYWVSDYQIAFLRSYSYDVICITFERYVLKSE